jgi:FkbM family methyltransferase
VFSRISRRIHEGSDSNHWIQPKQLDYPIKVRSDSSDLDVFCQIFVEEEYACLDNLKNVDLIIDCGANVGYSSAYFLSKFPSSRVIAVEADRSNYDLAVDNLKAYGDRVMVLNAAVWSHRTVLQLRSDSYRDGRQSSRQVEEASNQAPGAVEGVDLPYLISLAGKSRVSLLKVDIEGAEAVVFSPEGGVSDWIRCIDALVIELHDDSVFGPCSDIFHRSIVGQGFDLSSSGELTVCLRP